MKKVTFLFLFLNLIFQLPIIAQSDFYWSGNSNSSDNIDQADNWFTAGNPSSGDNLYFNNTLNRRWPYSNYGVGSFFGNIIVYNGANGIRWRGDDTYAFKFENFDDSNLFEIESNIGNRNNGNMEINPVGAGGITIFNNVFINTGSIFVYGNNTLTIMGVVSGTGGFNIKNNSTVIFESDNTFSGSTVLENGTLKLQGSLENSEVTVQSGATLEIDGGVNLKSLTVEAGGNVIVNPGMSLTVANTLTNSGTITLNSTSTTFSSIIPSTVSGSGINRYSRYTAQAGPGATTANNDLISPPVSGQTFGSFTSNNSNLATDTDGITKAFAPFNNNNDLYENYDTSTNVLTPLEAGKGYRVATTDGSNLEFIGDVNSGTVSEPISIGTGSFGIWNLIGNPYPSYISFKDFFDLLTDVQTGPSAGPGNQLNTLFTAIYGYDGNASDGWTVWDFNNINYATDLIAPGQGFFVASKTGGGLVDFTPNMRRIGSSDDFIDNSRISSENLAYTKLVLTNNENDFNTNIYFRDFNTRGLDPGYDTGGHFSDDSAIFTHLVENNTGVNLVNQSLPYADLDNIVVPVGIISPSGEQINISLDSGFILPNNINVYLEDNVANTWTLLNTNDYVFTPTTNLTGTGRFFVHFTTGTLSAEDTVYSGLQIFADSSNKKVLINGQLTYNSVAFIYDLQGRVVKQQGLNSSSTQNSIDTSTLNSGLYVVEVKNQSQITSQKIIIR